MADTDVIYITRVQKERFKSIDEYNKVSKDIKLTQIRVATEQSHYVIIPCSVNPKHTNLIHEIRLGLGLGLDLRLGLWLIMVKPNPKSNPNPNLISRIKFVYLGFTERVINQ